MEEEKDIEKKEEEEGEAKLEGISLLNPKVDKLEKFRACMVLAGFGDALVSRFKRRIYFHQ